MKAISLKPPWPSLIFRAEDPKDIENRTWTTSYRGPLVIHASKNWDAEGAEFLKDEMGIVIHPEGVAFGALIGVVELVDIHEYSVAVGHLDDPSEADDLLLNSKWAFGPYCWQLAEPRLFDKPIPWPGRQGLFDVPDETVRAAFRWICEFCFRAISEYNLPSDWDLVWQSAVCPDCQKRVAEDGGYAVVKGGAYASVSDPRATLLRRRA